MSRDVFLIVVFVFVAVVDKKKKNMFLLILPQRCVLRIFVHITSKRLSVTGAK